MKKPFVALVLLAGISLSTVPANAQNSKVVVYRKGCAYGSLAKYKVLVDHKKVATLKNNAIYTTQLAPGEHLIAARQPKRSVKIDVRSGQDYVVVYKTRFGIFGGRPHLKVMTLAQAKEHYKYFRNHSSKMTM